MTYGVRVGCRGWCLQSGLGALLKGKEWNVFAERWRTRQAALLALIIHLRRGVHHLPLHQGRPRRPAGGAGHRRVPPSQPPRQPEGQPRLRPLRLLCQGSAGAMASPPVPPPFAPRPGPRMLACRVAAACRGDAPSYFTPPCSRTPYIVAPRSPLQACPHTDVELRLRFPGQDLWGSQGHNEQPAEARPPAA